MAVKCWLAVGIAGNTLFNLRRGVVYRQKKRGGGDEAPNLSTVRGAPQNGDSPAEADVAHDGSVASQKVNQLLKSPEQSALEPTTIRSKNLRSIHFGYLRIDECTWKYNVQNMLVTATECSILGQEKKVWCA